ncbi:hypothetical protein ACLB2K_029520 [Fragaria x ananassa]
MEEVVTDYFAKMFQALVIYYGAVNATLEAIEPCVTQAMNEQLCRSYSGEEIKDALFQMCHTKPLIPDGMPPLFFPTLLGGNWSGCDCCCKTFFETRKILKQINYTHVYLIPKVDNPEQMSDLRPIALCNVIYKICAKVIVNRLKVILHLIISPFQSAFVPGRLSQITNEIAHDGKVGYMALKLDLSKAYNRMKWDFLKRVMCRFWFSSQLDSACYVVCYRCQILISG